MYATVHRYNQAWATSIYENSGSYELPKYLLDSSFAIPAWVINRAKGCRSQGVIDIYFCDIGNT